MAQSAVLLSFWYADLEDRCGSWHWIGVAIGVCQTIGMHRNPPGAPDAQQVSDRFLTNMSLATSSSCMSNALSCDRYNIQAAFCQVAAR